MRDPLETVYPRVEITILAVGKDKGISSTDTALVGDGTSRMVRILMVSCCHLPHIVYESYLKGSSNIIGHLQLLLLTTVASNEVTL